jgi:hypothetical protein
MNVPFYQREIDDDNDDDDVDDVSGLTMHRTIYDCVE